MVQGKLGELLVAADCALVERTALEKQVKQHLAQEQVKRKMLFFICFWPQGVVFLLLILMDPAAAQHHCES